ncbi:MAG: prepilin peptidase [Candidatus Cloacimonadia bacterium]
MLLFELLVVFMLGSCFGSFFNVCIYRIPIKKSIVFPRSHCPVCSTPIPTWLNIPYFGWLLTLGKCHSCKAKIHWHYMLVEFTTGTLFSLLYLNFGPSLIFLKYVILVGFLIIIFFIDLFHKIIPDSLSLPLVPLGLIFAALKMTDVGLKGSLIGGGAGFLFFYGIALIYWLLTKKMGLGGGDIKLIAGIGVFLGIVGVFFTIFSSAALALIVALIRGRNVKSEVPYGPYLVAGTLVHIFFGYKIIYWYLDLFLNTAYL